MLPQIAANPILGLGLGGAYRAPARSDALPEHVRYTHKGYLYMASKVGVQNLRFFVWCVGMILLWSWRGARTEQDPRSRGVHAAIGAGVLGVLLASITEPHLMRDSSLAFLGVPAGLTVALRRHARMPAPSGNEARATAIIGAVALQAMTKAERG